LSNRQEGEETNLVVRSGLLKNRGRRALAKLKGRGGPPEIHKVLIDGAREQGDAPGSRHVSGSDDGPVCSFIPRFAPREWASQRRRRSRAQIWPMFLAGGPSLGRASVEAGSTGGSSWRPQGFNYARDCTSNPGVHQKAFSSRKASPMFPPWRSERLASRVALS
jgi:hypothetical protein